MTLTRKPLLAGALSLPVVAVIIYVVALPAIAVLPVVRRFRRNRSTELVEVEEEVRSR